LRVREKLADEEEAAARRRGCAVYAGAIRNER
jgi:hypothetical protein